MNVFVGVLFEMEFFDIDFYIFVVFKFYIDFFFIYDWMFILGDLVILW